MNIIMDFIVSIAFVFASVLMLMKFAHGNGMVLDMIQFVLISVCIVFGLAFVIRAVMTSVRERNRLETMRKIKKWEDKDKE